MIHEGHEYTVKQLDCEQSVSSGTNRNTRHEFGRWMWDRTGMFHQDNVQNVLR